MNRRFASAAIAAAAAAAFAVPTGALAQFSMPSIGGVGGKSGTSAPAADLTGQQTTLVRNFVIANKEVLTANGKLLAALNNKTDAAKAEATANSLTEGASKGNIEDASKVVADSAGTIKKGLAAKPVLDAQAKVQYAEGVAHLVAGAVKYVGMGKDVKDMGAGLKSASPTQLPNLGSAAYIVSKFPGSASDLVNTVKSAVEFAKEQKIALPEDTLKALGNLDSSNG